MARRSYEQYCTLARALDIVGERWTLLIVRELMLGPRRFKDLLGGLPGIGRNLLAARLRHLEAEGLVRRGELPAPSGARVYELTEDGRALGPAMAALGRWGVGRLGEPRPEQAFRPGWAMFPLSYTADPEPIRGVRETYEFRVGDETFHLRADDGAVVPAAGPAGAPDAVVTMSVETLLGLFSGALAPADAVMQGRVELDGPPEALGRLLALYGASPRSAPGPAG
jgi:DNA-binding HxlR family transcriptional regulator